MAPRRLPFIVTLLTAAALVTGCSDGEDSGTDSSAPTAEADAAVDQRVTEAEQRASEAEARVSELESELESRSATGGGGRNPGRRRGEPGRGGGGCRARRG